MIYTAVSASEWAGRRDGCRSSIRRRDRTYTLQPLKGGVVKNRHRPRQYPG